MNMKITIPFFCFEPIIHNKKLVSKFSCPLIDLTSAVSCQPFNILEKGEELYVRT